MSTPTDFSNFEFIREFFRRFLPNTQAVVLAVFLLVGSVLIYSLSGLLMPVLASIILAYLLEGLVLKVEKRGIPRMPAVYIVFFGFMAALGFILFVLMPMVSGQAVQFVENIPRLIKSAQQEIMKLPVMYPQFFTESGIYDFMSRVQQELIDYGQELISVSAASVVGVVAAIVYLFLVPMMVFFFLKDKCLLIDWFSQFLPKDRHLTMRVWREVDVQIGNYVRGKFLEILILWLVSFIAYKAIGMNYAMLLAVLMGLSVVIPYVGATLVTFPVLAVAYLQWGVSSDLFMYVVIAYSIIQALDGVVLVPLLFSEAVNLHPIAIIVSILFFGGLWGFWGVFFAIPLATLVKAVLSAWPSMDDKKIMY